MIVVWQADDTPTRDAAAGFAGSAQFNLKLLHSLEAGVVVSENLALDHAVGEIILLIDDDAVAPPDWVERHLAYYDDPTVGAVGSPADNHMPDGSLFPRRAVEPIGTLTWYGKAIGNMYDHPREWRSRQPTDVEHLVGYNMSIRRAAFSRFESGLRPYWQMFELDACLQVRARGYRVVFDFGNVVEHHPTNTAYGGGRDGDLTVKIFNAAYNHAFVLSKHSRGRMLPLRLAYLLGVGSLNAPGLAGAIASMLRYKKPLRELDIFLRTSRSRFEGVRDGRRAGARRNA